MRKHILVIISSFRWGGINRSLQSWLKMIDPSDYDVDLFVMVHSGNYDGAFTHCRLLPSDKRLEALIDQSPLRHGVAKIRSLSLKVINRISKGRFQHHVYKKVGNSLIDKKRYDAVIAWGEGAPTIFTSYIVHPNKIAWIHCDYTNYTNGPTERDVYGKFKSIVCVSKYTRETFLSYYPEMEHKAHAIYNILDVEEIRQKAMEPMDIEYDKTKFNIVSVGRVSHVKRFTAIPSIARKLLDAGCNFRWYIVGPYAEYEGEYQELKKQIVANGVEECVKPIGSRSNSYPYIANADLHVCTSESESWSYAINEASTLGIPSVSTDFGAAVESIENGFTGSINTLSQLHSSIIKFVKEENFHETVKHNLQNWSYDNKHVINQIMTIVNGDKI